MSLDFSHLTTEKVSRLTGEKILFFPIGSVEQHGPHLPLSVDYNIPEVICSSLAQQFNGLIAPTIYYGARSLPQSGGGYEFPGTVYVRGEILIQYYFDVLVSFIKSGVKNISIINGHYENESYIFEAIDQLRDKNLLYECKVVVLSWWSVLSTSLMEELFGSQFVGWHAEHASLVETSLMMHLFSSMVNSIRVNHHSPPKAGIMLHPVHTDEVSCRGVLYRTTEASADAGERIFDEIIKQITRICALHFLEK